jgi:3-hydroxyisobutyrate dehydrogenase-like beta-hydroxyacid dehydrogenase
MNDKVAIVGLGVIGSVWAKHLHADGVLTTAWNRTEKSFEFPTSKTLETVPKKASIIHVVVSDEVVTKDVITTLCKSLNDTHTVVQSTTIDPKTSEHCKDIVTKCGAKYIESPFTGSLPAAENRETIFFVACSEEEKKFITPYLSRISKANFYLKNNTQACLIKLAMNLQIASAMNALSDALSVCRLADIDDETFFDVFKQNVSYSGVAKLKEEKLRNNEFSPQFSVKHMSKDMRLLCEHLSNHSKLLLAVSEELAETEKLGFGDLDFSAQIKKNPIRFKS